MASRPVVLLGGGGTGGHIFPNLAVVERLRERGLEFQPHLIVSRRAVDRRIAETAGLGYTAIDALPLRGNPLTWPGFLWRWGASVRAVKRLARERDAAAALVTGGFVSGPVVRACARAGVPCAVVSLDVVPGRANRFMARRADRVFAVREHPDWPTATRIGMPLRRSAIGGGDAIAARLELGLIPDRRTLLVFGGSQGAQTIDRMMIELAGRSGSSLVGALRDRGQVYHVAGGEMCGAVESAYRSAGVPARVVTFCDRMGSAWSAATMAVARAGAGSVSEAWAGAVPCVFLPYPFHKDQHQRLNAQPLVDLGGAAMVNDQIDAVRNADGVGPEIERVMFDDAAREAMASRLRQNPPGDGAAVIAEWLAERLSG